MRESYKNVFGLDELQLV